MMMIMMMIFIP